MLERLRSDYYYFNPQVAQHPTADPAVLERCYGDLVQSLDRVLKVANFTEMAHAEIGDAHDKRAVLRVAVNAKLGDFREVRFYRRGHPQASIGERGMVRLAPPQDRNRRL